MDTLLWTEVSPTLRPFHAMRIVTDSGFGLHRHDFWEIVFWQSGSAIHILNDNRQKMMPYDLFLLRPGDAHSIVAEDACHFINVAFRADFWEKFCGLAGMDAELQAWLADPVPAQWNGSSLVAAFSQIATAFASQPPPDSRNNDDLALVQFLGELSAHWRALQRAEELNALPDWLRNARVAMNEEVNLREGVPRLLQLTHVSPGHLSRTWKASFGQHPTDWINANRLELAASLLLETNLPIASIAARVGFENLTYFYRLFTAHFGQAPRAYRLQSRTIVNP